MGDFLSDGGTGNLVQRRGAIPAFTATAQELSARRAELRWVTSEVHLIPLPTLPNMPLSLYSATISSTSLLVRETRLVAELLISGRGHGEAWRKAILEDNVLQSRSSVAVIRSANILRARLEGLGPGAWTFMCEGDQLLARQTALAATIDHSRLVGDFLDIAVREQRAQFATHLDHSHWAGFIMGCRSRDPEMPEWSESTVNKLRSVVFTMLTEAGYLENTRTLRLQTVFVAPELSAFLEREGHNYVLRCMQVME